MVDIAELRQKSVKELEGTLIELTREGMLHRVNHAFDQLQKPHLLRENRRAIARVKTVIAEKRRSASGNGNEDE